MISWARTRSVESSTRSVRRPRPTGAFSRESMENTLNGKSKERWRWFDHPPVQPLLWRVQSLVPNMLVSRRLSVRATGSISDRPLRCLSRMPGNWHVRFLEGLEGVSPPGGLIRAPLHSTVRNIVKRLSIAILGLGSTND